MGQTANLDMIRRQLISLTVLLAAGCATQVPPSIREAPATALLPAQVAQAAQAHDGAPVRWGGTILAVHNRERVTDIEVLSLPLDERGEPRTDGAAQGRFLARIDGFVDPAGLPSDRLLTVSGKIAGVETHLVGDYRYAFPVVSVQERYLWPEPLPVYPPGWRPWPWYDPWYPFYDPWYPWYRRRSLW
ncbi:MAG: Slp family lipoprotein [Chromatiaceae bacterium]|nr:Slp family lipoprotein [Chromatiaceae bacterium]